MRGLVLSIGSELLRGDIIDRNAAFLTRELSRLGCDVVRVEQRGDDLLDLTAAFAHAASEADVIACTGGLGPTADDLTRQAIAAALEQELFIDQGLLEGIRQRFAALGRRMPDSNHQQAFLISAADALLNPRGTAPGWFVEQNGCTIIAMPGPPSEMEPMWLEQVKPRLVHRFADGVAMDSLMTFGLGESTVEERIRPIIEWRPDVTVATYAKTAGVEVHITARSPDLATSDGLAAQAIDDVRSLLGDAVFGHGSETLSSAVGRALTGGDLTVAVMESATGGALASMVTDTSGSSDYFLGGVVAYTREAKARHGVPVEVMNEHGLISAQTAMAMAQAARLHFGADIGLGTTGVAGSEAIEGKSPGTVFVAFDMEATTRVQEIRRPGDRETIKRFASQSALDLLRRQLQLVESTVS